MAVSCHQPPPPLPPLPLLPPLPPYPWHQQQQQQQQQHHQHRQYQHLPPSLRTGTPIYPTTYAAPRPRQSLPAKINYVPAVPPPPKAWRQSYVPFGGAEASPAVEENKVDAKSMVDEITALIQKEIDDISNMHMQTPPGNADLMTRPLINFNYSTLSTLSGPFNPVFEYLEEEEEVREEEGAREAMKEAKVVELEKKQVNEQKQMGTGRIEEKKMECGSSFEFPNDQIETVPQHRHSADSFSTVHTNWTKSASVSPMSTASSNSSNCSLHSRPVSRAPSAYSLRASAALQPIFFDLPEQDHISILPIIETTETPFSSSSVHSETICPPVPPKIPELPKSTTATHPVIVPPSVLLKIPELPKLTTATHPATTPPPVPPKIPEFPKSTTATHPVILNQPESDTIHPVTLGPPEQDTASTITIEPSTATASVYPEITIHSPPSPKRPGLVKADDCSLFGLIRRTLTFKENLRADSDEEREEEEYTDEFDEVVGELGRCKTLVRRDLMPIGRS